MTTHVTEKLYRDVQMLQEEVRGIKRFLLSPLEDPEGPYRKSFIKKMLARAQQSGPLYRFTSKEAFLKHVSAKK